MRTERGSSRGQGRHLAGRIERLFFRRALDRQAVLEQLRDVALDGFELLEVQVGIGDREDVARPRLLVDEDAAAVLAEIGGKVFAGGRSFGGIHLAHVGRVLVSDVPFCDAAAQLDWVPSTSLSLILRALPFEWAAAHRAGLGCYLARLPDAWTQWATPSLATVDRALSSGGECCVSARWSKMREECLER